MRQIVIMPGGFHPFHAGHAALYRSAVEAFNNADVYVAATNDTKTRPFPFAIKEKLAKLAGVADKHFVKVKSPFKAEEITSHYNPNEDVLIFVRSEKDKTEQPKPGGTKKDGTPAYFQPYTGKNLQPFSKHAYIAYLPTIEFGPGITSATEIRNAWPKLDDRRKTAMVMSLYPVTQKNPKLAANVVKMLDMGMGNELTENIKVEPVAKSLRIQTTQTQPKQNIYVAPEKKTPAVVNHIKPKEVKEGDVVPFKQPSKTLTWQQVPRDILLLANDWFWASEDNSGLDATIDPEGFGNGTANEVKYNTAKLQQKGWTIDYNYEYDGPGEFNLRLTNKRGQTVLLSIEDAQDFTGWAKGTNPVTEDYEDEEEPQGTTEQYGGMYIYLEDRDDDGEVFVQAMHTPATDGSTELGYVLFTKEGNYLVPEDLQVDERYQGQGIASTMYDYVKSKGYKIKRSPDQTDAGAGFWDKHRPNQNVWEGAHSLSVEELAHISDKALDDTYHYGRSTPGANFGWLANMQSAKAAKKLIDAGETDIEKISDAIHKGWNVTAAADYKGQLKLDTPTPDDKKLKRAKLAMQSYSQLPEEEKEKDRVVARALLQAIKGDNLTEFALPGGDDREPDEEEILRQLASQWWLGTAQQMAKAQRTLHAMGWEIGQDESGDDDAGVFVIRAGDENGNSYIAFPHSALYLDDINEDYLEEN